MFRPGWRFGAYLLLAGAVLTGCSQDRHVFISTVNLPTTVTLYDPLADQSVWSKDIPVGQKLVLDLDREGEEELFSVSGHPATMLTWELYDLDSSEPLVEDQMALPGVPIVIKVSYRPSPEYAPGYTPPYPTTVPAVQPSAVEAVEVVPEPEPAPAVEPMVEEAEADAAEPVQEMEPVEDMESIEAMLEMEEVEEQPAMEEAEDELPESGPLEAPMDDAAADDAGGGDAVEEVEGADTVIEVSPLDIELELQLEESLEEESGEVMEGK